MLALKAVIEWAITANEEINIRRDTENSLHALKSLYGNSKNCLAQMNLLGNARIRLGFVKAYLGIEGNEAEDTLAKAATTDGKPVNLPFRKSDLKNHLLQLTLSCWQAEWDNGETGSSV
ncbi:hypothetical protein AVEN_147919-1 [Araneus ventricosus]|uniref:Uncharacterized protein n=1 Tax=Araneus ventricosus TaxID=182803 RepID=A0A4Y1ZTV8_ARAVE|nr:hypothetical protein AVEN_247381-1 [Araneus ventricosus]GBL68006.1 hypothetical protein AVEN_147919-1 [Araneus ventricosus]